MPPHRNFCTTGECCLGKSRRTDKSRLFPSVEIRHEEQAEELRTHHDGLSIHDNILDQRILEKNVANENRLAEVLIGVQSSYSCIITDVLVNDRPLEG